MTQRFESRPSVFWGIPFRDILKSMKRRRNGVKKGCSATGTTTSQDPIATLWVNGLTRVEREL